MCELALLVTSIAVVIYLIRVGAIQSGLSVQCISTCIYIRSKLGSYHALFRDGSHSGTDGSVVDWYSKEGFNFLLWYYQRERPLWRICLRWIKRPLFALRILSDSNETTYGATCVFYCINQDTQLQQIRWNYANEFE